MDIFQMSSSVVPQALALLRLTGCKLPADFALESHMVLTPPHLIPTTTPHRKDRQSCFVEEEDRIREGSAW